MWIRIPREKEHLKVVMYLELRFLNNDKLVISTFDNDLFFQNRINDWVNFFVDSIDEETSSFFHAILEDKVFETFVVES